MQSSNAPNKIQLPFAASGTKNAIPVPSQITITPGAASYTDGFPPLTFTPKAAGGIPPAGADINGVLNAITAVQQWQSAGGVFTFDQNLANAIGGYPMGAVLLTANLAGLWMNMQENNSSDPDLGGGGWSQFANAVFQGGSQVFTSSQIFTVPLVLQRGTKQPWVTVIGGGGGGGMHASGGGGGGAGGAIASGFVNLTNVSSVPVTIGQGGNGAPAGSGQSNGQPGGTSSFGSYMSAPGGLGALNWNQGVPVIGVGGLYNSTLGPGGCGAPIQGTGSPVTQRGGQGGGPGGASPGAGAVSPGGNGIGPGGGGAGSSSDGSTGGAGGNGASGIVIVRW